MMSNERIDDDGAVLPWPEASKRLDKDKRYSPELMAVLLKLDELMWLHKGAVSSPEFFVAVHNDLMEWLRKNNQLLNALKGHVKLRHGMSSRKFLLKLTDVSEAHGKWCVEIEDAPDRTLAALNAVMKRIYDGG